MLFSIGIVIGVAACGSSPGADDTAVTVAPTSSTPVSVLPPTTTSTMGAATAGRPEACGVLASALLLDELLPRDSGNWPAERQRIITDAAANALAYEAAARVAPSQLVGPLGVLAVHARIIGDSVAAASSLTAARDAIAAAPDRAEAARAATVVEGWQRTTCR